MIVAGDNGCCFTKLKKEVHCFLYILSWSKDGKFVGDYVTPFQASVINVELFNRGCKITDDRLAICIET